MCFIHTYSGIFNTLTINKAMLHYHIVQQSYPDYSTIRQFHNKLQLCVFHIKTYIHKSLLVAGL